MRRRLPPHLQLIRFPGPEEVPVARDPLIKIESVSATMASQMLGTSAGNRPIRKAAVEKYARDMLAGKWTLNGEAIKFDAAGRLVDGHHRLAAIVSSKTEQLMLIVRNVPENAMLTLDTGISRSFHDASIVAGKHYDKGVGPVARWWIKYEAKRLASYNSGISHQELQAVIDLHPGILDSAVFIRRQKTLQRFCVPGVQGFVHAYASEKYDRELADIFMRDLNEGAKLEEFSPVYVLRRMLVEDDRSHGHYDQYRVLAFTIKSWNAWLAGDKLHHITWRQGGENPEPFPRFSIDQAGPKSLKRSRARAKREIERLQAAIA